LFQFWKRHDRQKSKMSTDELKDGFSKVYSLSEDIKSFILSRENILIQEAGGSPFYVIGAAPILIKDEIINIYDNNLRELLKNLLPNERKEGWILDFKGRDVLPTLEGLKIDIKDFRRIDLYRNGYLEFRSNNFFNGKDQLLMNEYAVVEYLISFFKKIKIISEYIGYFDSYIIFISFYNIMKIGLKRYININGCRFEDSFDLYLKRNLVIGPNEIDIKTEPNKIAQFFADRIWNAFGRERAPFFNKGKFDLNKLDEE
ncbi:hypothetical protein COS16_04450, partial [Candidatus Desantisbacteria bacterium CG02_land_8_20_14_3_00_49_13]